MKRVLVLLLAAALLVSSAACTAKPAEQPAEPTITIEPTPEPTPEPPAPTAREVWKNAEALAEAYTSFDRDEESIATFDFDGVTNQSKSETRMKGITDADGKPEYQIVSTGDTPMEIYYVGGTAYATTDYGNYRCDMDEDAFKTYSETFSIDINADCFKTISFENDDPESLTILYSEPTDAFIETFSASMLSAFFTLVDGTLQISGVVELDADGNVINDSMQILCDVIYNGKTINYNIVTRSELLSFNKELQIVLPSKVEEYQQVNSLLGVYLVNAAASNLTLAEACSFTAVTDMDLAIDDEPFLFDSTDAITYSVITPDSSLEMTEELDYVLTFIQTVEDGYSAAYSAGQLTTTDRAGKVTSTTADDESLILSIFNVMLGLWSDTYFSYMNDYDVQDGAQGLKMIHTTLSDDLVFNVLYNTLAVIDTSLAEEIYNCTGYTFSNCYAVFAVNDSSELPVALSINCDVSISFTSGEVISGTLVRTWEYPLWGSAAADTLTLSSGDGTL